MACRREDRGPVVAQHLHPAVVVCGVSLEGRVHEPAVSHHEGAAELGQEFLGRTGGIAEARADVATEPIGCDHGESLTYSVDP